MLVEQLLEEHPGLSPDRAEAALKLTKQNCRYNLYKAAAVLPGQEGAPMMSTGGLKPTLVSVWLALTDCTLDNGCMVVLPRGACDTS